MVATALTFFVVASGAVGIASTPAIASEPGRTTRSVRDGVTTYRVTDGFDLDRYMYRSSNPLDFGFDINAYQATRTDASGFPTIEHPLYASEFLLTVFAFDVDEEQGERDDVYVNGHQVGTLAGVDGQWSVNSFYVPGRWIKFGPSGTPTIRNNMHVDIDVDAAGWAVEVAWAELAVRPGPEPVVMVHGLNGASDGDGNGFNDQWDEAREYYTDQEPRLGDRLAAPVLTDKGGVETDSAKLSDAVDDLLGDTGFNRVHVLAHSFGGLTSRRYAFDNLGKVGKLVMVATPNGGSELATDVCKAQRANGLIRFVDPARWTKVGLAAKLDVGHCDDEDSKIYQLQQWWVRDVFNANVRDSGSPLPDRTTTDYYTIGGIGFGAANGVLNGEDDGMVELSSVFYLRPEDATIGDFGRNPNHPGRHNPVKIYNLAHEPLIQRVSPLHDAYCVHYGRTDPSCDDVAGSVMGSMAAASVSPPPPADVELVNAPAVDVAPGQTVDVNLALGGYPHATVALLSDRDLSTLSATLDGTPLAPADLLVRTLAADVWSPSGALQITNNGTSTATVGALVYAPAASGITVDLDRSQSVPGEPVAVTVRTGSASTPTVRYASGHDTEAAGTTIPVTNLGGGVWSGSFTPPGAGTWVVDAWTVGAEMRDDSAAVTVAAQTAQLTGVATTTTIDENGNGLHDALRFDVGVNVTDAGEYRVVADVVGADGTAIDSVSGIATLAAGAGTIRLRAEGRQVFDTAADGPYRLRRVLLSRDDAGFTLEDLASEVTTTTAYLHTAFEHDPVVLHEDEIEEVDPQDVDGDGLFDYIVVNVPVTVDEAGTYVLNGRLRTATGGSVTDAGGTISLPAGKSTVVLRLPTTAIGTGSYDEAFELRDLVVYRSANLDAFDYVAQSITTASYHSNQMEGFPVSPARNARWSETVSVGASEAGGGATTSVSVVPTATDNTTLDGRWDASVDSAEAVTSYDVDLATDANFTTVVATKTVPATTNAVTFGPADGVEPGKRYWFRVTAVSATPRRAAGASSAGLSVTNQPTGPIVAHQPMATAYDNQAIPISAVSTCAAGHTCSARLFWRATPNDTDLVGQALSPLAGGWHSSPMDDDGTTDIGGTSARAWIAEIPAIDVTTTGVDYFIEADDNLALTRVPGGTFVGSPADPDVDTPAAGYWHVHTVNPPLIAHQPVLFAQVDEPIPVTMQATCATGNCSARLYYRTTAGPITDETIVAENGELIATPDWPSVDMDMVGSPASNALVGDVLTFRAEIPRGVVDTRGVDYFMQVTDGTTQAWSPGTTYAGYYAPVDGMRTGWHHVHVLEPPHAAHAPVPASRYRADIPVTATSTCPRGRVCTARLYFRTTTSDALDTTSTFESVPMGVVQVFDLDGSSLLTLTGTIPGRVADTRGVDYFFSISDGTTTTWWPGTSHVDGYVPVEGTRVGYHHVRVTDPPHVVPVPVPAAPALQALFVRAAVNCVTEHCDVTLHYQKNLLGEGGFPHTIPMQRVGSAVGPVATYEALIPAEDVTTTGLSYYIEAFDGYTHGYAPGFAYSGAYLPVDGMRVQSFPVRVLEPPHLVHVPPTVAPASQPLVVRADANCSTGTCEGTLHWRAPDGAWQSTAMIASPQQTEGLTIEVKFDAVIPGVDVAVGMQHWIEVTDGYVADRTPTWTLQATT